MCVLTRNEMKSGTDRCRLVEERRRTLHQKYVNGLKLGRAKSEMFVKLLMKLGISNV